MDKRKIAAGAALIIIGRKMQEKDFREFGVSVEQVGRNMIEAQTILKKRIKK